MKIPNIGAMTDDQYYAWRRMLTEAQRAALEHRKIQRTEYAVNMIDEYGDIEPDFYDTLKDAEVAFDATEGHVEIEKQVSKYRVLDRYEMVDRTYQVLKTKGTPDGIS